MLEDFDDDVYFMSDGDDTYLSRRVGAIPVSIGECNTCLRVVSL